MSNPYSSSLSPVPTNPNDLTDLTDTDLRGLDELDDLDDLANLVNPTMPTGLDELAGPLDLFGPLEPLNSTETMTDAQAGHNALQLGSNTTEYNPEEGGVRLYRSFHGLVIPGVPDSLPWCVDMDRDETEGRNYVNALGLIQEVQRLKTNYPESAHELDKYLWGVAKIFHGDQAKMNFWRQQLTQENGFDLSERTYDVLTSQGAIDMFSPESICIRLNP